MATLLYCMQEDYWTLEEFFQSEETSHMFQIFPALEEVGVHLTFQSFHQSAQKKKWAQW